MSMQQPMKLKHQGNNSDPVGGGSSEGKSLNGGREGEDQGTSALQGLEKRGT